MTKSSLRAAALYAATTGLAVASEGGPEGLGEMQGGKALIYLLLGVAALGVVIWGMVRFLGRK